MVVVRGLGAERLARVIADAGGEAIIGPSVLAEADRWLAEKVCQPSSPTARAAWLAGPLPAAVEAWLPPLA